MSKLPLKSIAKLEQRNVLALISGGVFLILYFLTGTFHIGQAGHFPLMELEKSIPLVPWTIWIYVVTYPFIFWMVFEVESEELFNKCFYAYYLLLGISMAVFVFYPVSYPRELYPLGLYDDLSHRVFNFVRNLDAPTNCFPSLHVASSYLFGFFLWHQSKKSSVICLLMATLISWSTLTTKQHYIVDVISGFTLSFALYFIVYHFTTVKAANEYCGEFNS